VKVSRSLVSDALVMLIGRRVCLLGMRWAAAHHDLREAWDACPSGEWIAEVLVHLGIPFADIVSILKDSLDDEYVAHMFDLEDRHETCRDSRGIARLVSKYCKLTGVPTEEVAGALRDTFSYEDALERFQSLLSARHDSGFPEMEEVKDEREREASAPLPEVR
jgi:hypothetical protein